MTPSWFARRSPEGRGAGAADRERLLPMTAHPRHIPVRTCIACGKRVSKRDLVRVAVVGGTVRVDLCGKTSGRGAYLCREENGSSISKVRGRLGHALRTNIEDSDWEGVILNIGAVASGQH